MSKIESYEIVGRTFYKYQYSVLHLVEELHCSISGAIDRFEPLTDYIACEYLKCRLKNWSKTRNSFDEKVRELILVSVGEFESYKYSSTLEEVERYLKDCPDAPVYLKERVKVSDLVG